MLYFLIFLLGVNLTKISYIKIFLVSLRKAKIAIPYLDSSCATPKVEFSATFRQVVENSILKLKGGVLC